MPQLVLFLALAGVGPTDADAFSVRVKLDADKLEVGGKYELELFVEMAKGWSSSEAGMPAPILQIQAPSCVKLEGKVLQAKRDLSRNEYLLAPYERLIKENEAHVEFTLVAAPSADEHFALNVLAYVGGNDDEQRFVRKRIVVPITANASGSEVAVTSSDWGDHDTLEIGDKASVFSLPRADGTTLDLSSYLGKKNVIVTTYRAFW